MLAPQLDWNNHRSVSPNPETTETNAADIQTGAKNPTLNRPIGRVLFWGGVVALLLGASSGWIMSCLGY
jgi:hypothetical protein